MASTSVGKVKWSEGDACLAPDPRDGILREATIQRFSSTATDADPTVYVMFTDCNKPAGEEAVSVSKLTRTGINQFIQEKPVFPSSATDARKCVPLELNGVAGDKVPYTINRYLRDYQREGIKFIYNNYIRSRGCILGDDMGLGKTVQVIGFLAAVLHKTGTWEDIENNRPGFLQSQASSNQNKPNKVFLIVAPLSVLYNWKDELDTWGHFQCVVVHGLRKEEELTRIKNGRTEVALTTYETLRLCLDQFNSIDWSAVVVDEAHKIKNPNSQITQAMKELSCKIRVGLTGTILQNNLEELWCVMDWAQSGCLGSLGHFKSKFSDPIEQGQRHSATKRAVATGRKAVRTLVRKISHSFLRRTKALIKEQLPKKDDRVVYCSLTDFQHTVYQTVVDTEDVMLLLRSSEKCDCQSGRTRRRCCYKTNSEGVDLKKLYFTYLAILRKVANHVGLLQSNPGTSKNQEKYVSGICKKVFQQFPDFVQRCKDEAFEALSDPIYSGKMKVLQKLLKYYLQKKDKVLLFSLSTKLLDVLESYCMAEGLDYSRLDGNTKSKERVQIVKDFNSSSHINLCLVSTMAGGLGLNFVGANVVVLFDPTWNPANDLQAIDRAYRIGQCRDVTVLRLISLGTVEEVIYLRQVYKQQLHSSVVGKESARRYFEAVQGHDVHKGELFGIRNLFRLQTQGTCLTRQILEREGHVEAGVMTTRTHTGEEKEEEETKGLSEPENRPSSNVPALNNDTTKDKRSASEIPRRVLDFSSGSEEDEKEPWVKNVLDASGLDGTAGGHATTSAGRMSLLQHGFSKLLQGVKVKPRPGEGASSSDIEESTSDEGAKDQGNPGKETGSSSTVTNAACLTRVEKKKWDITSDSAQDEGNDQLVSLLKESYDGARKNHDCESRTAKKTVVDVGDKKSSPDKKNPNHLKRFVPKVQVYSDESEDLDIDVMTPHGKRGEKLSCNRKRLSSSVRNKSRTKYTEDIEIFTSSEDEHPSGKKSRPGGSHLRSPTTDASKGDFPTEREGAAASTGRQTGKPKTVSFTGLKSQTSPASKGKAGNIDSVLGGVKEVVYTHSNQKVVGGSKAEERISRAAMRDVFERKMFSQLPANHLLGTQESLSESPPDSQPLSVAVSLEKPRAEHPVTFSGRSVHVTRHTTFMVGETPQTICRRQLEEMAEKFRFPSAEQFAVEILRSNSTQRLTWLRQYYTSLNNPELAKTVTNKFPQPDSAQTASTSTAKRSPSTSVPRTTAPKSLTESRDIQKRKKKPKHPEEKSESRKNNVSVSQDEPGKPRDHSTEPQKKQKIPQTNAVEPVKNLSRPESEGQEASGDSASRHKRTKRGSVSSSGGFRAGGGLGFDQAGSGGWGPEEAAASLNRRDRNAPSSPDLSHGQSSTLSKPTAQGTEGEQNASKITETFQGQRENAPTPFTSPHHSLLTDLIGDTSILDDLFKPKTKGAQQRGSPKTPNTSSHSISNSLSKPSTSRVTESMDAGSKGRSDPTSCPSSHTKPVRQVDTPAQASKGSRKDFWDILHEGNEESINRLTDPAEVQRVCIKANTAARPQSGGEERRSLWKTNEKFLWKK